jgi:(S)-2-hydroxy-acid oxidase
LTNLPTGLLGFVAQMLDKSLDWTAIEWLKSITKLPVLVKGILSPEDAVLAVKHGIEVHMPVSHIARSRWDHSVKSWSQTA